MHGEVVVAFAGKVLADYAKAQVDLEAASVGSAGRVNVGAMVTAIPTVLVPAVANMKLKVPRATVLIEEGDLKSLLPRLRIGELDVVVGRLEPAYAAPDLLMAPLYADPSCCVVHSTNPIATRNRVTWSELAVCSWVMPQPWATLRSKIEELFRTIGQPMPSDTLETSSFLTMLSILRTRSAVALMPYSVAHTFESEGLIKIVPVAIPFEMAPVGIISVAARSVSPTGQLLLDCLQAAGKQAKSKEILNKPVVTS